MRCADDAVLWAYSDGSLPPDRRQVLEPHLISCDVCRQKLAEVTDTRAILRSAAPVDPQVKWRQVDDAVMGAATARFARANRFSLGWTFAGAALALAVAFAVWAPWPAPRNAHELSLAEVQVESAEGARFVEGSGAEQLLEGGRTLREGSRIHTDAQGSARVRLPDESRARLGPRTEAVLAHATSDAVEIQLRQGAVVVEASHAARDHFVVDAPEAAVRVVGTVFRVSRNEEQVAIAVSEGKVLVEPRGGGQNRLVGAGQRLVLGARGTVLEEGPLAVEELAAFAQLLPDSPSESADPVELEQAPPEPPVPPEPERTVTAFRRTTTGARPTPPSAPAPAPPEGAAPAPSLDPAPGLPLSELATPDFGTSPAEQAAAARPASVAERPATGGLPTTAEALFLQRAAEALRSGRCGKYLLGLGDITETSEDRSARETARILRARCFDDQLEPVKADSEYRKYLDRYPTGRFADEARKALAH